MTAARSTGRYDKRPTVVVPGAHRVWIGADAWLQVDRHASDGGPGPPWSSSTPTPASTSPNSSAAIRAALPDYAVIDVEDAAARPIAEIDELIAPQPHRRPGLRCHQPPHPRRVLRRRAPRRHRRRRVRDASTPPCSSAGAPPWSPVPTPRPLVLADLARWEIQQRQRARRTELALRQRRRGQAAQVQARLLRRVAHRRPAQARPVRPRSTSCSTATPSAQRDGGSLITGDAFRAGARRPPSRAPFRVVPFFDPGVWGGQWMKDESRPRRRRRTTTPGASTACPRRTRCCSRPAAASSRSRRWTWCSADPRELLGDTDLRPLRRRVPDPVRLPRHHGRRQPLAAGAPADGLHPATRSACPTPRTRATTCSTPPTTPWSTSG